MTFEPRPPRAVTPKPLPKTGTLQDLLEGFVWAFQQWTPEQQEEFRRESMKETYAYLSRAQWEKDNPTRPYEKESKQ